MLGVGASAVDRKFYPASLDRNTGLHLLSNAKCIFDLKFIAFVYSPYVGRLGCIHYCFWGEGKPDSFFFSFSFLFSLSDLHVVSRLVDIDRSHTYKLG